MCSCSPAPTVMSESETRPRTRMTTGNYTISVRVITPGGTGQVSLDDAIARQRCYWRSSNKTAALDIAVISTLVLLEGFPHSPAQFQCCCPEPTVLHFLGRKELAGQVLGRSSNKAETRDV
eukprot:scpid34031/ scgid34710/ 